MGEIVVHEVIHIPYLFIVLAFKQVQIGKLAVNEVAPIYEV